MSPSVTHRWRRSLRGLLEPLRHRFEDRRERHERLRRHLNQAHYSRTFDDYLTDVAVAAVTGGLAVGLLVLLALQTVTVVTGTDLRTVVLNAAIAVAVGLLTAVVVWYIGYTRPRRIARRRASALDAMLPSAVSYMYALAHGGLDPVEVVRRLADRQDTYGEQAREMAMVVNEMEYLGTDFVTALHSVADLTPSEATSDFLGDMVGVLESGGDFEEFLEERRQNYVASLSSEQESYLEQVGLYAEAYVTVLVAGPLFLIILLLVIGVLGASTLGSVSAIIYLGLPLGTAVAILALELVSLPTVGSRSVGDANATEDEDAVPDDPDAAAYARRKRRAEWIDRLKHPLVAFVAAPTRTLVLTVPLAVLAGIGVVLAGLAEPSVEAVRARPIETTALLAVLPFLVVSVPLAAFYEVRRRFVDRVRTRFPEVLSGIARANRSGIDTDEAIRMEAERSTGPLTRELRKLYNDIQWYSDTSGAFRRLADRARLATTTRTFRLLAEANEASGTLHRTLSVAADEARFQKQFADARIREVASYVAVAVISFLVFLGIILLLQQFYLEQVVEAGAQAAQAEAGGTFGIGMPVSLQSIDAAGFQVAFLHSVLIQGACIGLVAGKLARGTVLAGVKYSIGMVLVALAVFAGVDIVLVTVLVGVL